jgi:hypothetical protein
MSILSKKDLHTPFTTKTIEKLMSVIQRKTDTQAVAADLTSVVVADHSGQWRDAWIILNAAFETNEAMTVDIQVNGVSAMPSAAPQNFTAASAAGSQLKIVLDPLKPIVAKGDKISIIRNWTTGSGTDTTPANIVGLEWS